MKQVSLDLDSFYIRSKNCTSHFKQVTYVQATYCVYVHQILEKIRFRKDIQEVITFVKKLSTMKTTSKD